MFLYSKWPVVQYDVIHMDNTSFMQIDCYCSARNNVRPVYFFMHVVTSWKKSWHNVHSAKQATKKDLAM